MQAVFTVRLSRPHEDPVIVSWYTRDETAVSGLDYLPAEGVITFEPKQTEKVITIALMSRPALRSPRAPYDVPYTIGQLHHESSESARNGPLHPNALNSISC